MQPTILKLFFLSKLISKGLFEKGKPGLQQLSSCPIFKYRMVKRPKLDAHQMSIPHLLDVTGRSYVLCTLNIGYVSTGYF